MVHKMAEDFALSPYSDQTIGTWERDEEQSTLISPSHNANSSSLPSWVFPSRTYNLHHRLQSRVRRTRFTRLVKWSCYVLVGVITFITLLSLSCEGIYLLLSERRNLAFFPDHPPSTFSSWFTHGVHPISCHSHNDYWRRVPLWSALAAGCTSVEADVWPGDDDELRVGHSRRTILKGQSLRSLYLDPLEKMLDQHNPPSPKNTTTHFSLEARDSARDESEVVGVFANDPSQTLVLLIDFKDDAEKTWSLLAEQLEPLREKGYLSHFDGSQVISRPITIVATGDAPFHHIVENTTYRDVFYDAPVDKLTQGSELFEQSGESVRDQPDGFMFNSENSYYASASLKRAIGSLSMGRLSPKQRSMLQDQVREAHERGLKVRYWGTPNWPVELRNHVWRVLMHEGADVLNVDDLYGATKQDWTTGGWWR